MACHSDTASYDELAENPRFDIATQMAANTGANRMMKAELMDWNHVAGTSQRYNGANSIGQSAWVFDGSSTIDAGSASLAVAFRLGNASSTFSRSRILSAGSPFRTASAVPASFHVSRL